MSAKRNRLLTRVALLATGLSPLGACSSSVYDNAPYTEVVGRPPLITQWYTADPSAHVFEDRMYVYPSHDLDHDRTATNEGDQFDMEDYRVFSWAELDGPVTDHGEVLHLRNVPWATRQLWAPDAAHRGDRYFLYFPARDGDAIFRIGVATSASPGGPFAAEPTPIAGSFSVDPAVFIDEDGKAYMYFGGLWGGQLEHWRTGVFDSAGLEPGDAEPALGPRVALLTDDMLGFAGPVQEIAILDENQRPLQAADHARRFFEAVWVHRYNGQYYLSYSTGDTHYLVYATSQSPTGPFVFRGRILNPVLGWSTHHSIVEYQGKWFLFYHDSSLSGGIDHKRCIKYVELVYNSDGSIPTLSP